MMAAMLYKRLSYLSFDLVRSDVDVDHLPLLEEIGLQLMDVLNGSAAGLVPRLNGYLEPILHVVGVLLGVSRTLQVNM